MKKKLKKKFAMNFFFDKLATRNLLKEKFKKSYVANVGYIYTSWLKI